MALKVAFVHDWLVTWRGGEKVLEALLELFPDAPVYTMFYDASAMPDSINRRDIRVPRLLNGLKKIRKVLLPLFPSIIESFDLSAYDLIISTSSCVAKGAKGSTRTKHLCYIHSPMRYIWDQAEEYIAGVSHIPGARMAIEAATPRLRRWDIASSARVDRFVCNSHFVAERVKRHYGRDSVVIHPPIEVDRFSSNKQASDTRAEKPYFLAAGAFVSYKRFDLAIQACADLGIRLIVAGSGPAEGRLRVQAQQLGAKDIEFVLNPDDETFRTLLTGAEALIFPGVEDFGMIAIEAMACGTPVIAYAAGGALDFIREGETGCFFREPTSASLKACLAAFKRDGFDFERLRNFAGGFRREIFLSKIKKELDLILGIGDTR